MLKKTKKKSFVQTNIKGEGSISKVIFYWLELCASANNCTIDNIYNVYMFVSLWIWKHILFVHRYVLFHLNFEIQYLQEKQNAQIVIFTIHVYLAKKEQHIYKLCQYSTPINTHNQKELPLAKYYSSYL